VHESRLTLLRVRGIPIGVGWSWLPIAAFLTWWLSTQVFPRGYEHLSSSTYLAMALASALLFFVSIVLHELGHAFRALKEGMRIEGITLWLLGGVARFLGMFPSAGAELRIAVAGPLVSVGLAVAFGALSVLSRPLGVPVPVRGVLDYLAAINGLVVLFNLLPALPLDGGRILRAIMWKRRGDFGAATRAAATLGQAFGFTLGAIGIVLLSRHKMANGIWVALVGVFIVNAARSESSYGAVDDVLARTRVRDLMTPSPAGGSPGAMAAVSPETTIDDLIVRVAAEDAPLLAYPVLDGGVLVGLISLEQAGSVPPADRSTRTVAGAMTPRDKMAVLGADTPMREALGTIQAAAGPAVVTDGDRITGIVSMLDVARTLRGHLRRKGGHARPRRRRLAGGGIALAVLVGLGIVWHPPIYILSPGPATNVSHDMTITGVPSRTPATAYLLTTVRADQHTALVDLVEMFRPHREVVTTAAVGSIAFQDEMFRESRVLAAAAAGKASGLEVTLTGQGVEVIGLVGGSPAAAVLRAGDIITAVDGAAVHTEFDLEDAVRPKPAGTRFALTVQREGRTLSVTTGSTKTSEGTAIGIVGVTKGIDVASPFKITFVARDIGGPSAGLAYALAITDALSTGSPSPSGTVAATGTIDRVGTVGDVSGVDLKAVGARSRGARLFIVPADEMGAARGLVPDVKGVASLSDALSVLRPAA